MPNFKALVFSVISPDQLLLGLGQIKGRAVGLGQGGDEENHKGNGVEEHVPLGNKSPQYPVCSSRDLLESDGSHGQHDDENTDAHGDLIAEHLRRSTHCPIERVFVVARPTAEHHAVYAHRRNAEDIQQADVRPGDLNVHELAAQGKLPAPGNRRKGNEGDNEDDRRPPQKEPCPRGRE